MKFLFTILPALFTVHLLTAQNNSNIKLVELTLYSTPSGAEVYIDNVRKGKTPYKEKMKPGKYAYRVEKDNDSKSGTIEITGNEPDEKKGILVKLLTKTQSSPSAFGYLQIVTAPENGARVFIDDVELKKKTPCKSDRLKSGTHRVRCELDMYQPKSMNVLIEDGKTTNQTITLAPNFSVITISSKPSADIYIDRKKAGQGMYTGRILPGLHTIEGKLAQHESDKQEIETKVGKNAIIHLTLRPIASRPAAPRPTGVSITSSPAGASVFIDGVLRGTTPLRLNKLPAGVYLLSLKKTGFETLSKNIEVQDGETTEVNETLLSTASKAPTVVPEKKIKTTFLTVFSAPSDAEVYINGVSKGKTPYTERMKPGKYAYRVEKYLYASESGTTEITGDEPYEQKEISVTLRPVTAPALGNVNITSSPAGADIYIDGVLQGTTPLSFKMRIGAYQLILKKTGFEAAYKSIQVQDGETAKVNKISITLRPVSVPAPVIVSALGDVNITSYPAGASVFIDGVWKGTTPLRLNMQAGAYILSLMKTGFKVAFRNIEVQDGQTTEVNETLLAEEEGKDTEGDTLRSKKRRQDFRAFDILTGNFYALGETSGFKIRFPRIEFNTVEGVNVAYRPGYFKRWVGDASNGGKASRLEISPDFRYAHARRSISGFLKVEYKTKTGSLTLTGGKYIQQFNSNEPISPLVNTFYTLFQGHNYMKILERDFIDLHGQKTLKSKFTVRASGSLAKRHGLSNKIKYTYPPKNGNRLTSNVPVNLSRATASFSDHVALTGRLGLEIRPWQKSAAANGQPNSPHALSLNYTKGFHQVFGSRVDYDLLEAGICFEIAKELGFVLGAGKFLNTKSMYFMDYKHFAGNRTAVVTSDPFSSFRLLDYYKYSTNDEYFSAHIHYKFNLLSLIVSPKSDSKSENLFVSYLSAPYSGNFTEVGYSLHLLRLFRLEFAASFQNGHYANKNEYEGFRLGVSSRLAHHFSDK